MLLNEIFGVVDYIAVKETEGGTFTTPNRNLLLKEINISLFNEEWKKVEAMRNNPNFVNVIAQSPLVKFLERSDLAPSNTSGIASLSGISTAQYIVSLVPQTSLDLIELLPVAEANIRKGSIMTHSADVRPYAYQLGENMVVMPYDIGDLWVVYLRLPVTPYYDTCQDAVSFKEVYMPAGSYINEVLGVNVLYDENDTQLNANVIKSNMTYLPFPSATVELEWREADHVFFIQKILSRMSINLSVPLITQYAKQMNE